MHDVFFTLDTLDDWCSLRTHEPLPGAFGHKTAETFEITLLQTLACG